MQNELIKAVADGTGLRVEFFWTGDRFGHVVSLVDAAGNSEPVLESIDGRPDENWPPSPPLQSLNFQSLPDGQRAALLVGMAGGSHWSASIEPSVNGAELVFDMACRQATPAIWLGSRYRRLP